MRALHFLVLGERLFVYSETWLCDPEGGARYDMNDHLGSAPARATATPGRGRGCWRGPTANYIWRAAAHGGRGYLCARSPARLSRMRPPYQSRELVDLDRNVGGPLLARSGERLLVAGRKTMAEGRPVTSVYWLADDRLHEVAELPSGGDTSYPGFVDLGDGRGRSEPPCHVYLAQLSVVSG